MNIFDKISTLISRSGRKGSKKTPKASETALDYRQIANIITRGIALFSPKTAVEYQKQHRILQALDAYRSYSAAQNNGANRLWKPTSGTADTEIRFSAKKIRDQVRDLDRNNGYVTGAINRLVSNVVGEGNFPQSKIRNEDGRGLDKRYTQTIEDAFMRWSEDCGVNNDALQDLQSVWTRARATDGEGIAISSVENRELKIQVIEPEQLNEFIDGPLENGNFAMRGVEMDRYGRPLFYHVLNINPGDAYMVGFNNEGQTPGNLIAMGDVSVKIPASRVYHIFSRHRATQHRGVSMFAPVVMQLFDINEFTDSTMVLAKVATAFGVFIESPFIDDWSNGPGTQDGQAKAIEEFKKNREKFMTPGGINMTLPGEKVTYAQPAQPGPAYEPFIRATVRQVSTGIGQSYSAISGDYSQGNFSSERQAMVIEKALFRTECGLANRKANIPIFRDWLDLEVLSGRLYLPGYWENRAHFQRCKFTRPRQEYISPLQEANAQGRLIELNLMSRTEIVEDRGGDIDDTFNELQEEDVELKKRGLIQELIPPMAAAIPSK